MTIDLDKLADEVAGAVLDVIEEERRINRSDISSAVKKTLAGKITPGYGGYGVGTFVDVVMPADGYFKKTAVGAKFVALGDDIHVYRLSEIRGDHPLLPDAD